MREKIYTIPLNDAFDSGDECPFCYLEREAEHRAVKYTIGPGASYMEPEIRAITDREGFCRHHLKMLHDYGNALGCALIMQTYYTGLLMRLEEDLDSYELPPKRGLFRKKASPEQKGTLLTQLKQRQESCFVCNQMEESQQRYFDTFFVMLKDPAFREKVAVSKGFCMPHFLRLLEEADKSLPDGQRQWFRETIPVKMKENLLRLKEDLDWFVMKNDFRNAGLEWKNARDAVSRGMQKLQGGHPADPTFRSADYGARK